MTTKHVGKKLDLFVRAVEMSRSYSDIMLELTRYNLVKIWALGRPIRGFYHINYITLAIFYELDCYVNYDTTMAKCVLHVYDPKEE